MGRWSFEPAKPGFVSVGGQKRGRTGGEQDRGREGGMRRIAGLAASADSSRELTFGSWWTASLTSGRCCCLHCGAGRGESGVGTRLSDRKALASWNATASQDVPASQGESTPAKLTVNPSPTVTSRHLPLHRSARLSRYFASSPSGHVLTRSPTHCIS